MLERGAQSSHLAGDVVEAEPMAQLLGHSITYRIAVGPRAKVARYLRCKRCRRAMRMNRSVIRWATWLDFHFGDAGETG